MDMNLRLDVVVCWPEKVMWRGGFRCYGRGKIHMYMYESRVDKKTTTNEQGKPQGNHVVDTIPKVCQTVGYSN